MGNAHVVAGKGLIKYDDNIDMLKILCTVWCYIVISSCGNKEHWKYVRSPLSRIHDQKLHQERLSLLTLTLLANKLHETAICPEVHVQEIVTN